MKTEIIDGMEASCFGSMHCCANRAIYFLAPAPSGQIRDDSALPQTKNKCW